MSTIISLPGGIAVDPSQFGAKGDGVTDDSSAIQRALDAASLTGGTVALVGSKTYVVTAAPLRVPAGVTLDGNGALIDCTAMAAATALAQVFGVRVEGTIGSSTPLTSSNAIGDKSISVSTNGLVAGDIILVSSAEVHPVGAVGNSNRKGELHRIRSIDSGSALTISDGLFLAYDYTQSAIVQKITPATDVTVRNLRVKMGGVGKAHNGFLMQYAVECQLIDCSVDGGEDSGVRLQYCFGGGVTGGDFRNATSPAAGGGAVTGDTGYGVIAGTGSRNVTIEGGSFRNNKHSVAGGGTHPALLVVVRNNNVDGSRTVPSTNYDIECHEDCMYWTFRGNKITGSLDAGGSGGLMVRGQYCVVDANLIVNAQQYGIYIHSFDTNANGLQSCKVSNNVVVGARLSGIYSSGSTGTPNFDIEVIGNTVLNCGGEGIVCASTRRGSICDNTIRNLTVSGTSAIRLIGTSGDKITDLVIANNRADTINTYGLNAAYAEHITVIGMVAKGLGNAGANYTNCASVSHIGGDLQTTGATVHGIRIVDCTKMLVSGVTGDGGGSATTSNGVSISGTSSDITVNGCLFARYQYPVRATGTVDYISVIGVNGRNCTVANDIAAASHSATAGNL